MADICVTSTGRIFYRIDDGTAALLLEALPSVFERAKALAPAPAPTVPVFSLGASSVSGRWGLHCTYPSGEVRMLIPEHNTTVPKREEAAAYFGSTVWDGTEEKRVKRPLPVPDGIWERFVAANTRLG